MQKPENLKSSKKDAISTGFSYLISVMRRPRHVRVRSGQFEFVKLNVKEFDLRDTYHLILTLTWP